MCDVFRCFVLEASAVVDNFHVFLDLAEESFEEVETFTIRKRWMHFASQCNMVRIELNDKLWNFEEMLLLVISWQLWM